MQRGNKKLGLKVGMVRYSNRKDGWTKEEDQVLFELYQTTDLSNKKEILRRINRSWGAIRRRAKQLNLFRGNYIPPLDRLPEYNPSLEIRTWLACAIDCDGNISLYKRKRNDLTNKFQLLPAVSFQNTNRKIVEVFIERTFPNILKLRVDRRSGRTGGRHKDKYYTLVARMPYVYALLENVKEHLIVKKKQAEKVMEFIEIENERLKNRVKYGRKYLPRQLEIFEEVKSLNE